jgi:mRNA-degrading endonuclease RelE of RelBE toxin-antitoxin system
MPRRTRTRGPSRRSGASANSDVPRLKLKRVAEDQFAALPDHVQAEIELALLRIQANPSDEGVPLLGTLKGKCRKRVGGYRIIYRILEDGGLVIVDAIRKRGEAY